jgi:hypothetical protein
MRKARSPSFTVTRSIKKSRFTTHLLRWLNGSAEEPGCSYEDWVPDAHFPLERRAEA